MSEVKIEPIASTSYTVGEVPHWDEGDQSLLFVDISQGNVHRYFLQTQRMQNAHLEDIGTGNSVSFIIPVKSAKDHFVVGLGTSLVLIKWSPTEPDNQVKKPTLLLTLDDAQIQRVQINDAKCDDNGRLFAGTLDMRFKEDLEKHLGCLYSFDSDLQISRLVTNIMISNGLAWSRDNKTLYYIDSMKFRVDAFDYSIETGAINNRRSVFDYKSHSAVKGMPDGMCVDENDHLWVASFNGFQVLNIDPRTGKLIRIVTMPSRNITSCCFGGPDYSTLFVTSGEIDCQNEIGDFPHTGKTFAVSGLGVKGFPPNQYKINDLSKILNQ